METIISAGDATASVNSSSIRIKEEVKGAAFQVVRTGGDANITVAIQGSNDDSNFTTLDSQSIASGSTHLFRYPYFGVEYVRVSVTGAGTVGTYDVTYNAN